MYSKEETVQNFKSNRDSAENSKGNLREVVNNTSRKVKDMIHTASDEISHAKDKISHAKDNVSTQIRTKPIQSGLIAMAIGFVLGSLRRR